MRCIVDLYQKGQAMKKGVDVIKMIIIATISWLPFLISQPFSLEFWATIPFFHSLVVLT